MEKQGLRSYGPMPVSVRGVLSGADGNSVPKSLYGYACMDTGRMAVLKAWISALCINASARKKP